MACTFDVLCSHSFFQFDFITGMNKPCRQFSRGPTIQDYPSPFPRRFISLWLLEWKQRWVLGNNQESGIMESNFIVRVRNQTENIHVTQVIWYSTLSECFVECYDFFTNWNKIMWLFFTTWSSISSNKTNENHLPCITKTKQEYPLCRKQGRSLFRRVDVEEKII